MLNQSEQERETAGQIVDARSLARFLGEAPEPRAGVAGGHVPRSMCVPFSSVLAEGDITRCNIKDQQLLLSITIVFSDQNAIRCTSVY